MPIKDVAKIVLRLQREIAGFEKKEATVLKAKHL